MQSNAKSKRIATFAPLALGAITARLTAKVAKKRPQSKILVLIAENWRKIIPKDFVDQSYPIKLVFGKTQSIRQYVSSSARAKHQQKKATLTIAVAKGFAPIAMHRGDQLIAAINTYLGEEIIDAIQLKQQSNISVGKPSQKNLPKKPI